jgi:hypothetical protein
VGRSRTRPGVLGSPHLLFARWAINTNRPRRSGSPPKSHRAGVHGGRLTSDGTRKYGGDWKKVRKNLKHNFLGILDAQVVEVLGDIMREGFKTLIAVLGLIGVLSAGFMIYDRFYQTPRPNVPRYDGEIASRDRSSEEFSDFLQDNVGKIIYFDIQLAQNPPYDVTTKPARLEAGSGGKPFEFAFLKDCDKPPPAKPDPTRNPCTEVRVIVEKAQGVEAQIFNPVGATVQIKGYYFDNAFGSHMQLQTVNLHPISASQMIK